MIMNMKSSLEKKKDIAVAFANNLKFSSHVINQVNKPNRLMGLIRRSNIYLNKNFSRYLFNTLVRPDLEYCVSIFYPLLKKDEKLIGNIVHQI